MGWPDLVAQQPIHTLGCKALLPALDARIEHLGSAQRMIAFVLRPPAVARMILTHQTHFFVLFRSATTTSKRARSAALTSMLVPSHIPTTWGCLRPEGTLR